jgi:tetratricopeptide (TPR) repeat protein
MANGIGIDFGATACRAAIYQDGVCKPLPSTVSVADDILFRFKDIDQSDSSGATGKKSPKALKLESIKSYLGTSKKLLDPRGLPMESAESQATNCFKTLFAKLSAHFKVDITGAAIGTPSCYGMNQRSALRAAVEHAGLEKIMLLDECLAAAISVYGRATEPRTILAYCLGRSVFSVSVIQLGEGFPSALNHEGSTGIGSQDFEAALAYALAKKMLIDKRVNIFYDPPAFKQLIQRAEKLKISLSEQSEADLEIGPVHELTGPPVHFEVSISRDTLNAIIAPIVSETIDFSEAAITGAGIKPGSISEILLIGQGGLSPLIKDELDRKFNKPIRFAGPEAITYGAAIYAGSMHECFTIRESSDQDAESTGDEEPVEKSAPEDRPTPEGDHMLSVAIRARDHALNNSLDDAIQEYESLLELTRKEVSCLYTERATRLRHEGRIEAARLDLEHGLKHWQSNSQLRTMLAEMYLDLAKSLPAKNAHRQAKQFVDAALLLNPENPEAKRLEAELRLSVDGQKPKKHK